MCIHIISTFHLVFVVLADKFLQGVREGNTWNTMEFVYLILVVRRVRVQGARFSGTVSASNLVGVPN